WSVVEKTALAEAEVEYKDHKSTTIWVRFLVVTTDHDALAGASVMIWTTTPWTIPGNRAIAYGPDMDYVVIEVAGIADDGLAQLGEKLVMAEPLVDQVAADIGVTDYKVVANLNGVDLSTAVCRHPFRGQGYDFDVPLLPGDHVTAEDGTGFVHTAPGHGAEDFIVGQAHGIEVPQTVGPGGLFYDHVPLFAGDHVYKVNGKVADALREAGALLKRGTITHSYPHSWRSKAPLIFRNTPQWFISMDTNDLRQKALKAIDETAFYPEAGRNRLRTMIETRPDWCVSRQRAWGVPITVFVSKEAGEPLRDSGVMDRIVAVIEEEGADAWFASDPQRFLGDDYDAADYEQVTDILDVWFDSGSTHAFVLEARDELQSPASLYLEGSDQHRGWFHSSLLESCGTRGRAPYDGVLTHGFVLAEDKLKRSKSSGNTVAPQDVIKSHGADILRLWVVASDYSEDLKIGPEIIKHQADAYRRLRNTLRFLLGNLDGFAEDERVAASDMPELDRWVLHRLSELDELVRDAANKFDFHAMFTALHNFCAVDLSAFYFDVRKDILYCSRRDDAARRATRTVLDELFSCLTAWLAPILCFTAEEAWLSRNPGDDESVHLRQFPELPDDWRDDALAEKWETIRIFRRAVTGALEIERAAKRIGSSLQAALVIYAGDQYRAALDGIDMAEICITSEAVFGEGDAPRDAHHADDGSGISVTPALAEGEKCQRCWRFMPDVGSLSDHPTLCGRCADAVEHFPIAAVYNRRKDAVRPGAGGAGRGAGSAQ
ncbi:MAG: isoleucine--tRNA ligase, partial [Pseudomonadota bacterium]|nr:isoleucine--tRNA ligase [Pseudomonadota bacterium]